MTEPALATVIDPHVYLTKGICPACFRPSARKQVWLLELESCFTRLTLLPAMHNPCAREHLTTLPAGDFRALWIVHTSSPGLRTAKRFANDIPGSQDWFYLDQTPSEIDFWTTGPDSQKLTGYAEIQEAFLPAIKAIKDRATSDDEVHEITRQIGWLHKFLPPQKAK